MCNFFYILATLILKEAAVWSLIPASFGTFSTWDTQSADQPVSMVGHPHYILMIQPSKGLPFYE